MERLVIDRVEAGVAVCEQEDGAMCEISAALLPEDAREGDILYRINGVWTLAREETAVRRQALCQKQRGLFKNKR